MSKKSNEDGRGTTNRAARGAAVTRDSFANAPYADLVRHLALVREVDLGSELINPCALTIRS